MCADFKTDFSLTKQNNNTAIIHPAPPAVDNSPKNEQSEIKESHTARDIAIGAVGASLALVTLGVMARKGVFGKDLQKYLGGAEKEIEKTVSNSKNKLPENPAETLTHHNDANPENISPKANSPQNLSEQNVQPKENIPEQQTEQIPETSQKQQPQNTETPEAEINQPKEQPVKIEEPQQTYTTKLAETIKVYTEDDLDVYGIAVGKTFNTRGKTLPTADMLNKVRNNELTVLYDDTKETTEIILPIGKDFWAVKINGIVSQERAKNIFRTINANGISDPKQFHSIICDVLNGKLNTKYSIKNIGMYYDFHDGGAWKFEGGGGKWCTDGRMMLRRNNPQWKGYSIAYYAPPGQRTTTEIGVALPSTGLERQQSNHYSIFLDGVIPSGTVGRLIKHLETNVLQNPKDVKYEELAKIQEATLRFLNAN